MPADPGSWVQPLLRMAAATLAGAALDWERSRPDRAIMGLRALCLVGLGIRDHARQSRRDANRRNIGTRP